MMLETCKLNRIIVSDSKLVEEMVDMQWQFMDADYYKSNCRGAMYDKMANASK